MMFERADPQPSDQYLGSFYGLALPLILRGVPVEPVQIESSATPGSGPGSGPGFLSRYRLLLLTYEGQKPPTPALHLALARWVRAGGALVVVDNDDDPYNQVREWWNSTPNTFATPRQHLFAQLGIPADASGLLHVGKGVVLAERVSPAALSYQADGGDTVRGYARQAAAAIHLPWSETSALVLRRGPYVIAAGLDDSIPNVQPTTLHGRFVDLFDANLPILPSVTLTPGVRDLLFDLDYAAGTAPRVTAAACAVRNIHATPHQLSFTATGQIDTTAAVRIQSRLKPVSVSIAGHTLPRSAYQVEEGTILLHFANSVAPVSVEIRFE
jgi:hypothetical protein